ncbi:MAG: PmeII family type II restriction endonuclease [Spirosomataceae bacterium]
MTQTEKEAILLKFKQWFKESLIESHKKNTEKLKDINEFNINPFLLYYLSNFLEGNSEPQSLAKALIYPRVLGTSITTSFGSLMQGQFITKVLGAYGSSIAGIDIEFIDQIDGRKRYCQLKSGPNALNRDDVTTIKNHFKELQNRSRKNEGDVRLGDLVFCMIYGEKTEINSFVKELNNDFNVFIGKEFWERFTGDAHFYRDLIVSAGQIANEVDMKEVVEDVIQELSVKIDAQFKRILS